MITARLASLFAAVVAIESGLQAQCPGWANDFGNPGTNSAVNASLVYDDGSGPALYLAGNFTTIGGLAATSIARWNGSTWSTVGTGVGGTILTLVAFDDGTSKRLVAGGSFQTPQGLRGGVTAWDGNAWSMLGPHFGQTPDGFSQVNALCAFDDGSGPHLYACGQIPEFTLRWEGSSWSVVGGSFQSSVVNPNPAPRSFLVYDDGHGAGSQLYVGGKLQYGGFDGANFHVGTYDIARLEGGYWSDVGLGLSSGGYDNNNGHIGALIAFDDGSGRRLYAGNDNGVARWDGQTWSYIGVGIVGGSHRINALCILDGVHGMPPRLVAGGRFTGAGGMSAHGIAAWDGTAWSPLGEGIGHAVFGLYPYSEVRTLTAFDDGTGSGADLFVGGYFTLAGGNPANWMARYASCGGPATTFCYGDGSGATCPCGNASAVGARTGCLNSFGTGGALRVHGRAQLSDDTLVLEGEGMTNSSVLYFQGASVIQGGAGVTFGDGVKCTAGPFVRLGTRSNVNGASSYPGASDPLLSVRGQIVSAGTRNYQARYRNSAMFCTSETFNYTSGVSVLWSP